MKKLTLILTAAAALTLSACSNMKITDVDHKWCPPEQEAQVETVNLAADALFQFAKSADKDLLAKGKSSLDELAEKIKNGYARIDSLTLTGHTDRLGSEKANQKLGLNRAQTVRNYLQQRGIDAPIHVESAGESQPVTTDCVGNKATPALTACLQPDRRVTIQIVGIRKP